MSNSNFVATGLSGLSGFNKYYNAAKTLIAETKKRDRTHTDKNGFWDNLGMVIMDTYLWHPHKPAALIVKPYLDTFPIGSGWQSKTTLVQNDLMKRFPSEFGLPGTDQQPPSQSSKSTPKPTSSSGHSDGSKEPTNSSASGGSPSAPADIVKPMAKQSGMGWLGWTLLLGAAGGGAWWFINDDSKPKAKPRNL
jgi:hypothetical protein